MESRNMQTWKSCRCLGVQEGILKSLGSLCIELTSGRPQYDDNAIAVIITKKEKTQKYEKMMSGEEVLESW